MTLRINDTAPDFTANTTHGEIRFHEWIGDGYAVMFSHPKDFTPSSASATSSRAALSPKDEAARGLTSSNVSAAKTA